MRYKARAPLRIDFGGGWTDVDLYAQEHGGAVLAAAITQYAHGFISQPSGAGPLRALRGDRSHVSYTLDSPPGSGLGSSAAQTVLWVTLVKTPVANVSDRREIADIACRIAKMLGIVGGRQDEYASALGGITFLTFGAQVDAERLRPEPSFAAELHSRLVLVFSGTSRVSSAIHQAVWERYRRGDPNVVDALARLRELAGAMKDSLVSHDLDSFGRLIGQNWESQKALDASVSTPRLDAIVDLALRNGAIGGKACGAGGGGCVVFVAREGESDRLRAALGAESLKIIDFDFDTYGVYLMKG